MIKLILNLILVWFVCERASAQRPVSIIPKPVQMSTGPGEFIITNHTAIHVVNNKKELKRVVQFLNTYIKSISGLVIPVKRKAINVINLSLIDHKEIGTEGYLLKVKPDLIDIKANTMVGLIYGLQTLFQTLPQVRTNAALIVPEMEIIDYPRFKWRGLHLDVSRHFFSPEMVKEYIDLLASYKLNTFHWHLVDDQGWRIEIKKYPKLTDIGAWRVDQTHRVWSERPQASLNEKATYGGYYTQTQIKEIIAYAAERNVTVVPEIEMPGHVASAIAAYPFLSCSQRPQLPLTGGDYTGVSSNYCAGNEEVFNFLQHVLDEVIELFPSKYIHVGGDEVDKTSWKGCPKCQSRIKDEQLKDENGLQSYFITRIEKYIIGKNRKMIGWDEILEGGLAPEATVMSWRGEAGGIEAVKLKHDVIMSPGNPVYFDHYQGGPEGEPLAIGGFNTLKKVYSYEPIPVELSKEEEKYVLGAQANVWTEYITSAEHLEYMILPRMLALAEVVWSPRDKKDFLDFSKRLQHHFRGFEQKGLHYSQGNFTVAIKPASINGKLIVELSTEALNADIYYTLDGTNPTSQSIKYLGPINIASSAVLKAVNVVNGQVMGFLPAQQSFMLHKAIGKAVKYDYPVSRYYQADGPNSLTDGVRGTKAVGKYWHGFNGKDLVGTIDLESVQPIQLISIGCLQNYSDWIFLPQYVKFEVSTDGLSFNEVKTINNTVSVSQKSDIVDFKATFTSRKARFIRVTVKNLGACPEGHPGAGKPAWLFADEIIVQ